MSRPVLTTATTCMLVIVVVAGGCRRVPPPGGATGSKPEQARKQAEGLVLSGINGAAAAQAKAIPSLARKRGGGLFDRIIAFGPGAASTTISARTTTAANPAPPGAAAPHSSSIAAREPQPKAPPRPGSPAVIKVRVVSSFPYASETEAEEDALNVARDAIERRLAEYDPPVRYRPSLNEVKNEFARRDSRTLRPPEPAEREEYARNGVGSNLLYAEYDVEVTAEQIRELRTRDRVADVLRTFAGLTVIALAGFLFLRADEWTKGYLTRWLAFAAVALAGGAAAALYFV